MTDRYSADFGRTSKDYAEFRAGFPTGTFERLARYGIGVAGQVMLDVGTGTGTLARGFAARGAVVTGVDIAPDMLAAAREIAASEGLSCDFREASALATGLPSGSVDVVTAGQCWHWFDGPEAFAEMRRVLRPRGSLVICHFDWLPLRGNVVAATEELICAHSPDWPMGGGTGIYPKWVTGMAENGFVGIETFSFDIVQPYSHEAWRGRIRASAGVGGSLSEEDVAAFDAAFAELLARDFPDDPLLVPHRCWAAIGAVA